jgi:hypothetical protein
MRLRYVQHFFLAVAVSAYPGYSATLPLKKPLPLHAAIQDKNFYLLSALQASPQVHSSLAADGALNR